MSLIPGQAAVPVLLPAAAPLLPRRVPQVLQAAVPGLASLRIPVPARLRLAAPVFLPRRAAGRLPVVTAVLWFLSLWIPQAALRLILPAAAPVPPHQAALLPVVQAHRPRRVPPVRRAAAVVPALTLLPANRRKKGARAPVRAIAKKTLNSPIAARTPPISSAPIRKVPTTAKAYSK